MNSYRLLLSLSIFTPGLVWTVFDARAQTCTQAPSCSELGYTKSASDCAGKTILYCPFDRTKAYCMDEITCASLGFTDTVAECPGEYVKCPADSTKGKCNFEASPGDLKYSLRTSDHNGWLLCNGRSYSSSQYPELHAAISGSFGTKLPNYSGYFLKAAATSTASNLKTAEQAGLPNIYASWRSAFEDQNTGGKTCSGALSCTQYDSGITMEIPKDAAAGYIYRSFDASKSNSIYGRSTTVTPQNYSANVFIYAGRVKSSATDSNEAECAVGTYLNADGSCSKTLVASKNPRGLISRDLSSQWVVIWGGFKQATDSAGRTDCQSDDNYDAFFALETDLNNVRGKFTPSSGHTRAVAAIQTYAYYWTNFSNAHNYYYMYCNSTTCTPYGSVPSSSSSYYYYCSQFINK